MRDTARAPQLPTNPTTGHQMSRQGLAQNEQKCQFEAKFGRSWAKKHNFYWRNQKFWYDSIATVGEIRVYRRADFQSGSRVLKKVF